MYKVRRVSMGAAQNWVISSPETPPHIRKDKVFQ